MRRAAIAALALVVAAVAAPIAVREFRDLRTWSRIREGGVLRVGVDPSSVPFSFYGADGWDGYEADVARALASELSLTLAVEPVGYDGRFDALQVGRIDVYVSASTPEGGRPQFAWSRLYLDVGPRLLVRIDSEVRTMDDLTGARVAAARGGPADRVVRFRQRRVADLRREATADDESAERALRRGDVQGAVVSGDYALRIGCPPHGSGAAREEVRCIAVAPEPYAVLLRAEDRRLREAIDGALARIGRGDGPRTWQRRWFSAPSSR
jgi:polar amino acid transport system substrate-binding protein